MLELFHHFTHWVVFLWIIIAFYIMKNLLKNDKAERTTSHLLWDYSRIGRDWNEKLLGSTGMVNGSGDSHIWTHQSPIPTKQAIGMVINRYSNSLVLVQPYGSQQNNHGTLLQESLMVGNVFEIWATGAPLRWGHLPLLCVPQRHSVRSTPCPREGVLE